MYVNSDIIETLVSRYMRALMHQDHEQSSALLFRLRNYGIRVIVQDLDEGFIEWYREDEQTDI